MIRSRDHLLFLFCSHKFPVFLPFLFSILNCIPSFQKFPCSSIPDYPIRSKGRDIALNGLPPSDPRDIALIMNPPSDSIVGIPLTSPFVHNCSNSYIMSFLESRKNTFKLEINTTKKVLLQR